MAILFLLLFHALTATPIKRPISFNGFIKLRTLGGGASAVAYEVLKNGKKYALKKAKIPGPVLRREFDMLKEFNGLRGFPKAYAFFKCKDGTDCYIMQLVGPVLSEIQKSKLGSLREFPIATVGSVGIQMIDRVEAMHNRGMVHSDLYRNNIAPGVAAEVGVLYAIDFGQVCRLNSKDKCKGKIFDLRSVAFTILGLLKRSFRYGDFQHFSEDRSRPSLKQLVHGLPHEVYDIMKYVLSLAKDADEVDYDLIRASLVKMIAKAGAEYNGSIIWPPEVVARLP